MGQAGILVGGLGIALPVVVGVPCHDLRHQERVGTPVRDAEHAAEGMGQAVGDAERGVGEGHACHAGGVVHLLPRQQIVTVAPAGGQVAKDLLHHLLRQGVGKVAGRPGDIGLQRVAQHVHPGVGGDGWRYRCHQRRIENGDIRQQ